MMQDKIKFLHILFALFMNLGVKKKQVFKADFFLKKT